LGKNLQRRYLEEYEEKEREEYNRLVARKIEDGTLDYQRDRYPPDERFRNLHDPVADIATLSAACRENLWAQIPFSGSVIFPMPPATESECEEYFFAVSDIPEIIRFVKETGKLQFVLSSKPTSCEGLDYLVNYLFS
jgi:hypothetical protein